MNSIKGDLLNIFENNQCEVLVHGCNCFCTMGSGIARLIANKYPQAYESDKKTIKGDKSKLGTNTYCNIDNKYIVNAYTQYNYGKDSDIVYVNYEALKNCFSIIKKHFSGMIIAYPKIGCGLANGDWNIVSTIIDEQLKDETHFLVELP